MVKVEKAGATPNLLKYRITADQRGQATIDHATLLKDARKGPLKKFINQRCRDLENDEAACLQILCNPSTRVFVTHRTLPKIAVDAIAKDGKLALTLDAEAGASAIIAIEFRHSLAA